MPGQRSRTTTSPSHACTNSFPGTGKIPVTPIIHRSPDSGPWSSPDAYGLPLAVTFHGFCHTVSTKLRNVKADIREIWIDALLGHEASHKSMGTLNYTSGIDVENLRDVMECLKYKNLGVSYDG
ncbi:site-specific integrase [Acetobacter thailandicus]|uniref:hypothetical protein n=1 Tax=Acetobacter thailandicus TaxID=1502842 RepID=UPI001BA5FE53|nr:hypothetical protein [Acetobacter thailandicus]